MSNAVVISLRNEHPEWTLEQIGKQAGVTRERTRQILKRAGLPTRRGFECVGEDIFVYTGEYKCRRCGAIFCRPGIVGYSYGYSYKPSGCVHYREDMVIRRHDCLDKGWGLADVCGYVEARNIGKQLPSIWDELEGM